MSAAESRDVCSHKPPYWLKINRGKTGVRPGAGERHVELMCSEYRLFWHEMLTIYRWCTLSTEAAVPPKRRYTSTRLNGVTHQMTAINLMTVQNCQSSRCFNEGGPACSPGLLGESVVIWFYVMSAFRTRLSLCHNAGKKDQNGFITLIHSKMV